MRSVDSRTSSASSRALTVAAIQRSAAPVAGPASSCTRASQRRVDARARQRLGELPRLLDADVLERLEQLVLGVGGVQRAERVELARRGDRLLLERDELLGLGALDARRTTNRSIVVGDDVERLGHVARRRGSPPRPGC